MNALAKALSLINEAQSLLEKELSSTTSGLTKKYIKPNPTGKDEHITADQIDEIMFTCTGNHDVLENMLHALRLKGIEYMPRTDYRKNIERLRKIIGAANLVTRPID